MERTEILELMSQLQLAGMRAAYDEIVTAGVKRNHGVERVIGALLQAEIATKHARSINYQMGLAKLPLVKELSDLSFYNSSINGELVESFATGTFLDTQRSVVLVGGTGTGKSHIAIGIARSCIRQGAPNDRKLPRRGRHGSRSFCRRADCSVGHRQNRPTRLLKLRKLPKPRQLGISQLLKHC